MRVALRCDEHTVARRDLAQVDLAVHVAAADHGPGAREARPPTGQLTPYHHLAAMVRETSASNISNISGARDCGRRNRRLCGSSRSIRWDRTTAAAFRWFRRDDGSRFDVSGEDVVDSDFPGDFFEPQGVRAAVGIAGAAVAGVA